MSTQVTKSIEAIKKAVENGSISEERINHSCRKILRSKYQVGLHDYAPVELNGLEADMQKSEHKALLMELQSNSITLTKNEQIIPFSGLETFTPGIIYFGKHGDSFLDYVSRYQEGIAFFEGDKKHLKEETEALNHLILAIEAESQHASRRFGISEEAVETATQLAAGKPSTLVLFGNPYALSLFSTLDNFEAVVVCYSADDAMKDLAAQALYGGISIGGRMPVSIAKHHIRYGDGEKLYKPIRLSYGIPEMQGMSSDTLLQIDSIIYDAIQQKATPGAQLLVARNGMVVYHKAYGTSTYKSEQIVNTENIFDLASITKIAATLPILMHLEEKKIFNPLHPIADYLPGLDTTNKSDISSMEILAHQGGLQAWIPFYKNILADKNWMDLVFSHQKDSLFSVPVAKKMWVRSDYRDSIYFHIYQSELRENKDYKYSDLGFYLFHRLIEEKTKKKLNELCDSILYKPLGAKTLCFLPTEKFPVKRILATEDDREFRKEIIQGKVHDPGAILMGGVGGHAGLFGNANDLAKLMQMYLWNGKYGGDQFLSEQTIEKYTRAHFKANGNRRGLGFDKPEFDRSKESPISRLASPRSYGHSGFTGTIAWVDPDKNLVYILLSNRIHPDSNNKQFGKLNVRPKVADVVYRAVF